MDAPAIDGSLPAAAAAARSEHIINWFIFFKFILV